MASKTEVQTEINPWLGLSFVMGAFVFRLANANITASELPAFEAEFGIGSGESELTLSLFLAIAGAMIVPVGMLADRYGRVAIFSVGTVGMMVANLISALAPNFEVLLASRVLEALAFPAMGAASLALVAGAFADARQRSKAFALYGASYGLALALASGLGGYFAQDISWRWTFAVNIPVLAVALFGVRWCFSAKADRNPNEQFDGVGSMLLLLAVVTLLLGLDGGPIDGWFGPSGLLIVAAIAFALATYYWERARNRRGLRVLFNPNLLRTKGFLPACGASFLMMIGGYSVYTVMPAFWGIAGNRSILVVGLGLVPLGVAWMCGALLSVPVGRRLGARRTVILGLIVAGVGLVLAALVVSPDAVVLHAAGPLAVLGLGMGVAYARLNEAGLRNVGESLTGLGSGMLIGSRLLASALGAVLLAQGLLSVATLRADDVIQQAQGLPAEERAKVSRAIQEAGRGRSADLLTMEERDLPEFERVFGEVQDSYATAAQLTLGVCALMTLAGAVVARQLPRDRRETAAR